DSPDQIRTAIAHAIGIYDGPERSAASALSSFVADRSMILILDNMEHILTAADEVAAIVHASPTSRIIVTSRAPLRIAGEHEFSVAPLVERGTDLFIDRARAVRVGWEAGTTDAEVIAEICHLLDDLPLGIELAAARVAALPPSVIRDRLAARLPLPGSGPRDAPARQRTLEGAGGWRHDLLPPDRQEMLHRLGVFEGGFDLEQVDAVVGSSNTGDHLDALLELADQSLIVATPTRAARARFRMLRTIQSFALDRLAQDGIEADVRRRHAEGYLALTTQVSHLLNTSRHSEWLDRMAPEQAN